MSDDPSKYGSVTDADRKMVSLRLSAGARIILKRLAGNWGVSQSAVLEVLLREAVAPTNRNR